jgi:hypothetical protein
MWSVLQLVGFDCFLTSLPTFVSAAFFFVKGQLMYKDESRSGQRRVRQEDQFEDALQLGPQKKLYVSLTSPVNIYYMVVLLTSCVSDPLIHHGWHFGRTHHALCSIRVLLRNGLIRQERLATNDSNVLTIQFVLTSRLLHLRLDSCIPREEQEHRIFQSLLKMIPSLECRLLESSEEELRLIADLVGASKRILFPLLID